MSMVMSGLFNQGSKRREALESRDRDGRTNFPLAASVGVADREGLQQAEGYVGVLGFDKSVNPIPVGPL